MCFWLVCLNPQRTKEAYGRSTRTRLAQQLHQEAVQSAPVPLFWLCLAPAVTANLGSQHPTNCTQNPTRCPYEVFITLFASSKRGRRPPFSLRCCGLGSRPRCPRYNVLFFVPSLVQVFTVDERQTCMARGPNLHLNACNLRNFCQPSNCLGCAVCMSIHRWQHYKKRKFFNQSVVSCCTFASAGL